MALPFTHPISQSMPGFGSPSYYGAATQTPTTTAAVTITIANTATTPSTGGTPFNLSGGPAPSSGKWRLRMKGADGTTTLALQVTVTDGTSTVTVATIPASVATADIDYSGEINTDLAITGVAFVVTPGGTSSSIPLDAEVSLV